MDPADPHNLHDTADKPVWERIDIATEGNDCDECVRALREPLMKIKGVKEVVADPKSENVWVTFDARKTRAQHRRGVKTAPNEPRKTLDARKRVPPEGPASAGPGFQASGCCCVRQ